MRIILNFLCARIISCVVAVILLCCFFNISLYFFFGEEKGKNLILGNVTGCVTTYAYINIRLYVLYKAQLVIVNETKINKLLLVRIRGKVFFFFYVGLFVCV